MKFITNLDTVFSSLSIRNSLQLALIAKDLLVETEVAVRSFSEEKTLGIRADMVIHGCLLLELKTAEAIIIAHEAQLLNYLRATNLEVGLILNFGPKAQVRRLAYDNTRKQFKSQRAGGSY